MGTIVPAQPMEGQGWGVGHAVQRCVLTIDLGQALHHQVQIPGRAPRVCGASSIRMERCCSPPLAQGHLQPEAAIGLQPEGALPCQSAARFAQAAGPEAGTGDVEPAGLILADVETDREGALWAGISRFSFC